MHADPGQPAPGRRRRQGLSLQGAELRHHPQAGVRGEEGHACLLHHRDHRLAGDRLPMRGRQLLERRHHPRPGGFQERAGGEGVPREEAPQEVAGLGCVRLQAKLILKATSVSGPIVKFWLHISKLRGPRVSECSQLGPPSPSA